MAATQPVAAATANAPDSSEPKQAGLLLATLIIVAAVANLPLAMAIDPVRHPAAARRESNI